MKIFNLMFGDCFGVKLEISPNLRWSLVQLGILMSLFHSEISNTVISSKLKNYFQNFQLILRFVAKLRILSWDSDNLKIGDISSLAPTSAPSFPYRAHFQSNCIVYYVDFVQLDLNYSTNYWDMFT